MQGETSNLLMKAFRAGLQSGPIMALSDAATQLVIERKSIADGTYDVYRSQRWALAGLLLHGPFFFLGFSFIDKRIGPVTSIQAVAQKTAFAQFCLFPPYLVGLFGFMGVLEGHPNISAKITQRVPEAFLNGCLYWPVANGINFALIPPTMRVPYIAVASGIWNSYLSWMNARDQGGNQQTKKQKQ